MRGRNRNTRTNVSSTRRNVRGRTTTRRAKTTTRRAAGKTTTRRAGTNVNTFRKALELVGGNVYPISRNMFLVGYGRRNFILSLGNVSGVFGHWAGQCKSVSTPQDALRTLGIQQRRASTILNQLGITTTRRATTRRTMKRGMRLRRGAAPSIGAAAEASANQAEAVH
jgi:hypothetical protein